MDDCARKPRGLGTTGFTLFEVLAASLILVLVGTMLIGSMNADLHRMSDARMRMTAGRLADSKLAQLESSLIDGAVPEMQNEEEETDNGFVIKTIVGPYSAIGSQTDDGAGARPSRNGEEPPPKITDLIAKEFPGLPSRLRAFAVIVEWQNGLVVERVRRVTFGFDRQGAVEALQEIAASGVDERSGNNAPDGDTPTRDDR